MEITSKNARQWSRFGPRATYGMTLYDLVEKDERIYALSADLGGSSGLNRLMNAHPDRYMNVGIAEQNLIGVSAGLAKEGLVPFASSFAPFITLRCADQVRMNMGYMHLNIKTVGLGSGVSMGGLGNSHYGLEDIAFMRSIPGMTVICPADCSELVKVVEAAAQYEGPVYMRLTGEPGMPVIYDTEYDYEIGRAVTLCEGGDVAIIATGSMVHASLKASELLAANGISCSVIDMHTVKPLDTDIVKKLAMSSKLVVTVEEHSIVGGLGSAVAQEISAMDSPPRLLTIGLPDFYLSSGSYQYMLKRYGLTAEDIVKKVISQLS